MAWHFAEVSKMEDFSDGAVSFDFVAQSETLKVFLKKSSNLQLSHPTKNLWQQPQLGICWC
jgi:hypothetical protein